MTCPGHVQFMVDNQFKETCNKQMYNMTLIIKQLINVREIA